LEKKRPLGHKQFNINFWGQLTKFNYFCYPFTLIIFIFAVEISFKSRKLEKQLTDPKEMAKSFGQLARKVNQRLKDLTDADNLAIIKSIPAARCHELTGDRKGELAVDVSGNYRLIFEPNHDPIPKKADGGLNWEEVTSIQIKDIQDYH
jgi:plasmid maintenance system killer protein